MHFCRRSRRTAGTLYLPDPEFQRLHGSGDERQSGFAEEFSGAEIEVLDSASHRPAGAVRQGGARLRDDGIPLKTAVKALERIRNSGRIFFTTKDLKYLERGGRIGKAACLVGSMLEIKPLLRFYDGELGPSELCRGRKRSLQKVTECFYSMWNGRRSI